MSCILVFQFIQHHKRLYQLYLSQTFILHPTQQYHDTVSTFTLTRLSCVCVIGRHAYVLLMFVHLCDNTLIVCNLFKSKTTRLSCVQPNRGFFMYHAHVGIHTRTHHAFVTNSYLYQRVYFILDVSILDNATRSVTFTQRVYLYNNLRTSIAYCVS